MIPMSTHDTRMYTYCQLYVCYAAARARRRRAGSAAGRRQTQTDLLLIGVVAAGAWRCTHCEGLACLDQDARGTMSHRRCGAPTGGRQAATGGGSAGSGAWHAARASLPAARCSAYRQSAAAGWASQSSGGARKRSRFSSSSALRPPAACRSIALARGADAALNWGPGGKRLPSSAPCSPFKRLKVGPAPAPALSVFVEAAIIPTAGQCASSRPLHSSPTPPRLVRLPG